MAKCPQCKTQIERLTYTLRKISSGDYHPDEGYEEDGQDNSRPNIEIYSFSCPECDTVLFDNEIDADEFLKGKIKKHLSAVTHH